MNEIVLSLLESIMSNTTLFLLVFIYSSAISSSLVTLLNGVIALKKSAYDITSWPSSFFSWANISNTFSGGLKNLILFS